MILDINNPTDFEIFKAGVADKSIGITSGCYDLLHHYHLLNLQRCRRFCDILVVGVDSDDRVKSLKGAGRPIVPEHNRVAMIDALKVVHAAFVMDCLDDLQMAMKKLGVTVIFRNQEWEGKENEVVGCSMSQVVIINDIPQVDSTTAIIAEIYKRR